MTSTSNFALPLVQPSQAQKHVTVNEALIRLDGLAQLILMSVTTSTPPISAGEGACYGVPVGAVNDWAGHEGEVAVFANGGWIFVAPKKGWRGWIADISQDAQYDGANWRQGALVQSPNGAESNFYVTEIDHVLGAGATDTTIPFIPPHAMIFGVSGIVTEEIIGSLADWSLGKSGSPTQFGSGLGLSTGSYVKGTLSFPSTEYAPTSLLLTANGGDFTGGKVRLAVHYYALTIPEA